MWYSAAWTQPRTCDCSQGQGLCRVVKLVCRLLNTHYECFSSDAISFVECYISCTIKCSTYTGASCLTCRHIKNGADEENIRLRCKFVVRLIYYVYSIATSYILCSHYVHCYSGLQVKIKTPFINEWST